MPFLSGYFLVARPTLQDPNFRQTVVLLLKHTEEGAFGLVINRPASLNELPFPVFGGGPCPAQGLLMLHGHAEWIDPLDDTASKEIAPGIYLGDASSLDRAMKTQSDPTSRWRVFSGYSGWGPGQLESELAAGAWTVTRATPEVMFDVPIGDIWERVAPPRIPQPSVN